MDPGLDQFLRELARVSDISSPQGSTLAEAEPEALAELSGRFAVLRPLGKGGFGAVYAVRDRVRQADVALKLLRRRDAQSLYWFKREFRALAALDHPNLLRLFEFFAIGERWCFTMELLEGVDVATYVRRGEGAEREQRIREVLAQLLEGLAYLHARGLLHRDLKPANLLVTPARRLVVLDFGLVAPMADGAVEGEQALAGTRAYMAPELARGGPVGAAADLYAVGVVLYELLTGQLPPRDGLELEAGLAQAPGELAGFCLALLSASPAARPSAHALREQLVPPDRRAPAREGGFVGREAELAALGEALRETRQGAPVAVLLHGVSGSGKTTLLQQFIQEQRRLHPELLVLSGRCFAQVSMPHEAIDGVVDDLYQHLLGHPEEVPPPSALAALGRLFPVLRQLGGSSQEDTPTEELSGLRPRAAATLASLLAGLARRGPLAIVMDDFQWADLDSARLLGELMAVPVPALLWIVSHRSEDAEASPALAALREAVGDRARTLVLDGLGAEQAERLAVSLGADAPSARRVASESQGNPFFLTELCRHAGGAQGGTGGPAAGDIRASVAALIRGRVAALPAAARKLLDVVSMAGYPLERSIAVRAALAATPVRLPEPAAIRALVTTHLVRIQQSRGEELLAPYHHRVGELVSAELSREERRDGHRRIAQGLVAVGVSAPGRLLLHLRGAEDSAGSARYALEAARQARAALAFERAAELYAVAIELGVPDGAAADEVEVERAEALRAAGHSLEAAEAFLRAVALRPSGRRAPKLRQRAMEQLLLAGHVARGLALLRGLQAELGLSDVPTRLGPWQWLRLTRAAARLRGERLEARRVDEDAALRVDVCHTAAQGMLYVEPRRMVGFHLRQLELARATGDRGRILRALSLDAILSALGGRLARCRADLAAIQRIAAAGSEPGDSWGSALAEGVSAMIQGHWSRASERLAEYGASCRRLGFSGGVDLDRMHVHLALCEWARGDIPALVERVTMLDREAERRGNRLSAALLWLTSGLLVPLCHDEPGRAWAELERASATVTALTGGLLRSTRLMAELRVLLYEGRGAEAWERLSAADAGGGGDVVENAPMLRSQQYYLRGAVALAAGRLDEAARASRWLRWWGPRWAAPLGQLIEGCLVWRREGPRPALRWFSKAEEGFRRGDRALLAEVARWRGSQCAGGAGQARVEEVAAWMRARGIQAPARLVAMFAPVPGEQEATSAGRPAAPAGAGAP
ncbi:MAG: protein kinase [Myxococcaceae bacterium]|nr:protein kinase [Myxococcaceae bacterium]